MDYENNLLYKLSMYFPILALLSGIVYFCSVMRILFE